jgi:hypothetical protein
VVVGECAPLQTPENMENVHIETSRV